MIGDEGVFGRARPSEARILVVDDEQPSVDLPCKVLERQGYSIVWAGTDARAALEVAEQFDPALLIADLHMPGLDGIALMQSMRASRPDRFLPVLMVSADTTGGALHTALAAGVNDFVTKPLDLDAVVLRVRNLLELSALHDEVRGHSAQLAARLREITHRDQEDQEAQARSREEIAEILREGGPDMVFQPLVALADSTTVGVESLARFTTTLPLRPPDHWFGVARSCGLGLELELAALSNAVSWLGSMLENVFLSVNLSPTVLTTDSCEKLLLENPLDRIVVEITEHDAVTDYAALIGSLARLRDSGARVAVDDAGAGYASLRHVMKLRPEFLKLDIDLTRGVHSDPVRRAVVAALVRLAEELGGCVVAEGIETTEELQALRRLGVSHGQGFLLRRPGPLDLALVPVADVALTCLEVVL